VNTVFVTVIISVLINVCSTYKTQNDSTQLVPKALFSNFFLTSLKEISLEGLCTFGRRYTYITVIGMT